MDIRSLIRNPERIKANLTNITATIDGVKTNQVVCKEACQIVIPQRYADLDMARIEKDIYICGIFAYVMGNFYAVNKTTAMMHITPSSTEKVLIDEEPYFVFSFDAGSVVIYDTALVKRDVLAYSIFDLFFSKGKVPWFMNYMDLNKVFDTANKHAGVSVGNQPEVIWLLTSIVSRDPKDVTKYFRQAIKDEKELINMRPLVTPLQKVSTSATNTFNKLAGNYQTEGIRSALIYKTKRKERMEKLLVG